MTKNKKTNFFLISLCIGLLFLLLSFFVNKDVFRNLDFDTLVYTQGLIGRNFDLPFSLLTLLGSSEVILTIVTILFCLLFWRKKHLFPAIFLIFSIYIFELAGKIFIYHPKPPVIFNRYVLHIFLPSSFIVETNFSYPSGHMARVSFLAFILIFLVSTYVKNKMQRLFLNLVGVIFVMFVFISRIYLGEHWLSDVLGGFILGGGLATLALGFW